MLQVIKKSRDPRWDEEFQFTLDEAPIEDKIHIEVMNKRSARLFRTKVKTLPYRLVQTRT